MRRETRQLSLAEALVGGGKGGARLERITGTIDWGALDGLLAELRASRTGRPGWPPLAMLKALLLAQWYGLSDPELEDALSDRLSFRRFVGLPLDGGVPDETTLCRFRNELVRRGLTERLLAAVDAQLAGRGLVLKRGTLIDASLVEADADVRKGPDGQPVTVEPEAGFAKRRDKAFFGFKAHLAVDEGSGLVRRAVLTPANVNESVVADALPIGDEAAVYADMGYDSAARRALLAERGVFDEIYAARPSAPAADGGGGRPQPRPRADPVGDRAGLRHAQAQLPMDPGPLSRPRPQRRPPRPALPRPQPAPGGCPHPLRPPAWPATTAAGAPTRPKHRRSARNQRPRRYSTRQPLSQRSLRARGIPAAGWRSPAPRGRRRRRRPGPCRG
jgi:IS5 family transposase